MNAIPPTPITAVLNDTLPSYFLDSLTFLGTLFFSPFFLLPVGPSQVIKKKKCPVVGGRGGGSGALSIPTVMVITNLIILTLSRAWGERYFSPSRLAGADGRALGKVYSIYIPWPFHPVWGVADNTKEQRKQWGIYSVLLAMTRDPAEFGWHCWSNTAHPPTSSTKVYNLLIFFII